MYINPGPYETREENQGTKYIDLKNGLTVALPFADSITVSNTDVVIKSRYLTINYPIIDVIEIRSYGV